MRPDILPPARSIPAEESFDPCDLVAAGGALFSRAGLTIATYGVAATLPVTLADLDEVDDLLSQLRSIAHKGPGGSVLAIGALPFDRAKRGYLVVPQVTYKKTSEGSWLTTVGDVEVPLGKQVPTPTLTTLIEDPMGAAYAVAVGEAVARIDAGLLAKVVLARTVVAQFDGLISIEGAVRRLLASEPDCTAFAMPLGEATFVGASPELLISRRGPAVTSHPLAATVTSKDAPSLAGTAKSAREHQLVVDEVVSVLRQFCGTLDVPEGPSTVRLGTVAHLGTMLRGSLRAPHPSALHLAAFLHPTPAVGGSPQDAALKVMAELEPAARGHWAGPVGWVDATGDGDWVIGIRSALVEANRARLTAGAGIVAGSDPTTELAETTTKMVPILDALAPGSANQL